MRMGVMWGHPPVVGTYVVSEITFNIESDHQFRLTSFPHPLFHLQQCVKILG